MFARIAFCLLLALLAVAGLEWKAATGLSNLLAAGACEPPFGPRADAPDWRADLGRALDAARAGGGQRAAGRFDRALGWTNSPGNYFERGVEQRIGAYGTRGPREYEQTPPAGVRRVLCYGDSFTFGSEVVDGEDWPSVLDDLEPGLEVLNLGVAGWGLDQALRRFRTDGADLRPDAVVFGLSLDTIARHTNRLRNLLYPNDRNVLVKPRYVLQDGELVFLPQPYETRAAVLEAALDGTLLERMHEHEGWADDPPGLGGSWISRLLAARRAWNRRDAASLWRDPSSEAFQVTMEIVQHFHDEALAAGARQVCFLVFPRKSDWVYPLTEWWTDRVYWKTLRGALLERGIDFVDLFPALRPYPTEEVYLDQHFSAKGNRVVAEHVRGWLAPRLADR